MDIVKPLLNTVFVIAALLMPGVMLLMFSRKKKLAKTLLFSGMFLLCLLGFHPFSDYLLWRLESRYPPLMDLRGYENTKYVVVLTAWDSEMHNIPPIQNLGYRSAFRTMEAHRIYREMPGCKIIISGTQLGGKLMSTLLVLLGVPESDIGVSLSSNTLSSAVAMKEILQDKRFFLVTSAIHLPRSMLSFSRQGMKPIPAPADYLYGYHEEFHFPRSRPFHYYFPNTEAFMNSSAALYEYLGLVWYQIEMRTA